MIGAMGFFSLVDGFTKLASRTQSVGQILALTSGAAFVIFVSWVWRDGGRLLTSDVRNPAMLVRMTGEVIGSVGIISALALAPLPSVAALAQAQPLAVTLGAALFLGEKVGWRRWSAVILGLTGVLIILRPGVSSFDPNLLWVFLYIFGLAARDLASRALPTTISTPYAVAWAMLALTICGAAMMPFQGGWHVVEGWTAVWLAGITLSAAVALWMITSALRAGEVSAVAPFRYTRILFTLSIAYLVFDDVPDFYTWVGVLLIVGTGIYTFLRERQVKVAITQERCKT